MNRDADDRAIADLGAAYDRVATNMYLIDSHPGLGFLKSGGLSGRTEEIWRALSGEIDSRWAEFSALGTGLEQARTIRVRHRSSDAEWGPMEFALSQTLPRLAAALETSCATIAGILSDVNAAWTTATTASAPIADALAALTRRADELGDPTALGTLGQRVTRTCDHVLTDPIDAAPAGTLTPAMRTELTTLAADIASAAARVAEQERARDAFPEQVDALARQIDAVADAENEVRAAYARAQEKIVNPGLPVEPRAAETLRVRAAGLESRREKKDWRRLADDIAMTEASSARALIRAQELISAADGLIARRDELRGRLEAYRSKAASHRLDEHGTLAPLHTAARRLLYTAPCDLHAATKAVYAYQKALAELVNSREEAGR